ncbi:hypothetical protein [Actinomadura sp. DC4]|uniref:hypothetical protein n=1 Tax=Actinomadura sp. DC4 TaxID=3055069 RepID=UPI0025B1D40B|nr:hypothetical protein [Actinomadura sp. DC4]MDN3356820.1 hypothetical protein [Actinomadura sp. DC4]
MAELPKSLERRLYDAFHLNVHYNRARHEATIQVTIREETIITLTEATQDDRDDQDEGRRTSGVLGDALFWVPPAGFEPAAHGLGIHRLSACWPVPDLRRTNLGSL